MRAFWFVLGMGAGTALGAIAMLALRSDILSAHMTDCSGDPLMCAGALEFWNQMRTLAAKMAGLWATIVALATAILVGAAATLWALARRRSAATANRPA